MIRVCKALTRKERDRLREKGLVKEFRVDGVLWVKKRPWKKWGKVEVYQYDPGLGVYIKLFEIKVTGKEWEGPKYY